jgi:hypothetical protein
MDKSLADSPPTTEGNSSNALIQLHVAEYQALTTRASYWIVLQISLLPVVPIYLTLAAELWKSNVIIYREIVIWSTVAGLQLIGIVWAHTVVEQFNVVRYIELYLRPLVKQAAASEIFWNYEPHLSRHRPAVMQWGGYFITLLSLAIVTITGITRYQTGVWSLWDTLGLILNLIFLVTMSLLFYSAQNMLREWSDSEKNLAQKIDDHIRKINQNKL